MEANQDRRQKTSDQEILSLLECEQWPLGSTEVAEAVGITQQGAYNRLRRLADKGQIERKTTGGTTIWRPV